MYSNEIIQTLKSKGIEVGDKIRVEKQGQVYEGVLLPRPEGNPEYIVIKLKTGYNTGINFDSDTHIELIGKNRKVSKKAQKPAINQGLPTIKLIHTGGTIASRVDYETGGVSAGFSDEDLLSAVPEIFDEANVRSKLLFNVMSEDINYKHWIKIAEEIVDSDEYGVVVAHGTDTMGYTSAALSFMVKNLGKPVILTGAQRSSDRPSSDAFLNLLNSFRAAKLDISGVYVNMHDTMSDDSTALSRGTRVRKMHTSRRDAFMPINDGFVARIFFDGKVEILQEVPKRRDSKPELDAVFEPKTALIKIHPNFDPEIIDHYVDRGFKGIIFEGTGLGHLPVNGEMSVLPSVERAIDSGLVIGMTSQCLNGRVHSNVYANLRKLSKLGVVYLEDMLSETAYVKLGWLLGHDYGIDEIKKMMLANMIGEINNRSLPDRSKP